MARNDPLTALSTRRTPQSRPADGATVRNSAGGHVFAAGDDVQVHRFLVLGTTGGTYYAGEREHTRDNAELIVRTARERGLWLAEQAAEVSIAGRAPRQQPALFALAAVAGLGDEQARAYALKRLPEVARTGSTLFTWLNYVQLFRGWGPQLTKGVARWYLSRQPDDLAYQLVKYRSRDGWTHRDVLRQAHPKAEAGSQLNALLRWVVGKGADMDYGQLPEIVEGFTLAQAATTVPAWVALADRYSLSWEMLPDAALTEPDVWAALLQRGRVPIGALVRQLPRLTKLGLATGDTGRLIVSRLTDAEALKKGRIHPVNVLVAQRTYASGQGKGGTWTPARQISDALDRAFYAAFGAVTPSGGRTLVALDISASMTWARIVGMPLNAREASAAMALVTVATEDRADVVGFTSGRTTRNAISELDISPRRRLDDVIRHVDGLRFGGTDCALPMLWAIARGQGYDTFVIYTDSETWAGSVHPWQALREHREKLAPNARLVVVGMTSTGFSIADPEDPGQLDVAGFDSATPQLIADFGGGRL